MTKTYNDIEAVSRLLEEKERDLELAARIGQTLLSKNKELSARNECLDEQLGHANDRVNQLRHDLSLKEELLRFYNEDLELESSGKVSPSESGEDDLVNVGFLHKKLENLETENLTLKLETANLKSTTECYEDKEKRLVEDCIKQLAEVNCQVETFAAELQHKADENEGQKEQINKFLSQTNDLQVKIRKLTVDNMDLHDKLSTSTDSQKKLTKELKKMQDKYDELYEMLEEAQTDLKMMRTKHKVRANDKHQHKAYAYPTDSLGSELETSLQQELAESTRRAQSWKIFETARAAKRAMAKVSDSLSSSQSVCSLSGTSTQGRTMLGYRGSRLDSSDTGMSSGQWALATGQSMCVSDGESFVSDGYSADMDSLYGSNQELGRPGIPGSNDLESALRRLALRDDKEWEENLRMAGRQRVDSQTSTTASNPMTPPGSVTPSSISCNSPHSRAQSSRSATAMFKASDKLKIMKPLEGSVTLRHWQHLATPNLGRIFESKEGVQMKGERRLDTQQEVMYCLSDFEEDESSNSVQRERTSSALVHSLIDAAVRSPAISGCNSRSMEWLGIQDPRTPSPGLAFYNQTTNSPTTFNHRPMQSSTPVLNSDYSNAYTVSSPDNQNNDSNGSKSGPMSLGLAALLDSPKGFGGRAAVGGSLSRAALSTRSKTEQSENIDLNINNAMNSNATNPKRNLSFPLLSSSLSASSLKVPSTIPSSSSSSSSINSSTFSFSHRLGPGGDNNHHKNKPLIQPGSSILLTTQNLLSRYKSNIPGSRSFDASGKDDIMHDNSNNQNNKLTQNALNAASNSNHRGLSLLSPNSSSTVTSSTSIISSPIDNTASSTLSASGEKDKNAWVFSPDMTGQGFIQQLKNRGYSLYGLWSNATAAASAKMSATPISSSTSSLSTLSTDSAMVMSSESNNENDVLSSTVDSPRISGSGSSVTTSESSLGVLGSYSNLRRGKML